MSDYRFDVYSDAGGAVLYSFNDFFSFALRREVNGLGKLDIVIDGKHPAIDQLVHRGLIELWRKDDKMGIPWTMEFRAFFLGRERLYPDREVYVMHCLGPFWLLSTRCIAWDDYISYRTLFNMEVASIARVLVIWNATALATVANGRLADGEISGMEVEVDNGGGPTVYVTCCGEGLLDTLQGLAEIAQHDFDLEYTGANTWEFHWYTTQLGADRSASVVFSMEHGNMREPVYTYDRRGEKTRAIVRGPLLSGTREVAVVDGADYDPDNNEEVFVNAAGAFSGLSLAGIGLSALGRLRANHEISFKVLQTPARFYGKHYFLGDKVTARMYGAELIKRILAVEIDVDPDGKETIGISLK